MFKALALLMLGLACRAGAWEHPLATLNMVTSTAGYTEVLELRFKDRRFKDYDLNFYATVKRQFNSNPNKVERIKDLDVDKMKYGLSGWITDYEVIWVPGVQLFVVREHEFAEGTCAVGGSRLWAYRLDGTEPKKLSLRDSLMTNEAGTELWSLDQKFAPDANEEVDDPVELKFCRILPEPFEDCAYKPYGELSEKVNRMPHLSRWIISR